MKHILFIIGFLSIAATAFAQLLPFRSYSIEKGLSESVVNDLLQDDAGYLWIGTSYGLNRFDGFQFHNYYEEDGLLNNKIYSLYEDSDNRLWIGTGGGVNVMEDDSIRTIADLKPLEASIIRSIYEDRQGGFWFATDGQGMWYYDRSHNLTQYISVHGLANDRVRDILEDNDGTLWFATRGGLSSLKNGNFRTYTTKDGLPENRLRDIIIDRGGQLWIASRDGLVKKTKTGFKTYSTADGLANDRIQSLSLDNKNGLWIGTEEGASHFTNGTFKNYTVANGLSNNIIYSTLYDREGNIWFGTFGGGINLFLGDYIQNYTVEEGLPNNVITSITEDREGYHWITNYGGGLSRFDGSSFKTFMEKDGLVDNKAYTVVVDNKDRLLVGTRWGLSIYNHHKFLNFGEDELPYPRVRAITVVPGSDDIWLGTYGEGVILFKNDTSKLLNEGDGLADNTILSALADGEGSVWFATYGGVSRYQNGTFTNYTIADGLPNNGIIDILKANDGSIWVSTFGGIARFNDGSFEAVTPKDGLPDEVGYFILQDRSGLFWIGTKKGIVRFDYKNYLQSKTRRQRLKSFKLYTQAQGLVANEMNAGAGFVDREGYLWLGSVGGLSRLDPRKTRPNPAGPKVHIENIRLSGERINKEGPIEIGSNNHNISFDYVGISFTAPNQVVYEYRLKGSGESWQQTTQRSVRYSALLPGQYTFQIRAENSDGKWSEKEASVSFTVLAPFWMQWWFITLAVLLIIGTAFFVYNFYRIRKMVEIERMRVRIASDLHDDVGSALTEIALQSDFLQTTDASADLKQSLSSIGTQSRKIVSSLDDIVWSIDARNDTLGDLTDRMQDYLNNMLSSQKVLYHFEELNMQEKLPVTLRENLYLIFKEAVNNIAKHSNATKVDVKFENKNGSFDLWIKDNGTGNKSERKTGHGLRNMKMRAERIDAAIEFTNKDGFGVHVFGKGM